MARKRHLSDPEDGGWSVVQKRKKAQAASSQNPNPRGSKQPFNKFKVVVENKLQNYHTVQAMSKTREDLNMVARPNLQGQWILTPKDHQTYQYLTTLTPEVVELRPETKLSKAIINNYPLVMNLSPLTNLPNIQEAVRQTSKAGQYTQTVLLTFTGPIPAKINLGIWGVFYTKKFNQEPLRCFNCQRFGHHKTQCTALEACAVCSGRHSTSICVQAFKEGKDTRAKCPNCKGNHHAWNPRCPERLRRIPVSNTSQQTPIPAPRSNPPAPRQAQPAPRRNPQTPRQQNQTAPRRNPSTPRQLPITPKPQRQRRTKRQTPAKTRATTHQTARSAVNTPAAVVTTPVATTEAHIQIPPSAAPPIEAAVPTTPGFWEEPSLLSPPTPLEEDKIISYTEAGLKTLLRVFAQSIAALIGVSLQQTTVDQLVEELPFHQAQVHFKTTETATAVSPTTTETATTASPITETVTTVSPITETVTTVSPPTETITRVSPKPARRHIPANLPKGLVTLPLRETAPELNQINFPMPSRDPRLTSNPARSQEMVLYSNILKK